MSYTSTFHPSPLLKAASLFLLGLLSLYVFVPSLWAQGKPQAAVSPVAVLGDVPEVQKQIVFNSLLTQLTQYYDLISQEQFLKAQDSAFEALEGKNCTEDQCIQKIQEILQIENMFILQILRDGTDTQLSLTLVTLEKKLVESDFCLNCNTRELNQKVSELVRKIVGSPPPPATAIQPPPASSVQGEKMVEQPKIKEKPAPPPEPEIELPEPPKKQGESSNLIWHVAALSLTGISAAGSTSAATEYNKLSKENEELQQQYNRSRFPQERLSLKTKYDQNQKAMAASRASVQTYDGLTVIGLIWETYLIIWGGDDKSDKKADLNRVTPSIVYQPETQSYVTSVSWYSGF